MNNCHSRMHSCRGIKVHFWTFSPPISLYHFPLLQAIDSKKPSSPFKDLNKSLKPIPAISFPFTQGSNF